jgi:hypothetical protein
MSDRKEVTGTVIVDGVRYFITLMDNFTVEDVLVTEAQIQAAGIVEGKIDPDRRVEKVVRDVLIKTGMER